MNPNDFGEKILMEQCQSINISDVLKKYKLELKQLLINTELELIGTSVNLTTSQTGFKGIRFWFVCPNCNQRTNKLIIQPYTLQLGCRKCLNIDYRKHRYSKMIESRIE